MQLELSSSSNQEGANLFSNGHKAHDKAQDTVYTRERVATLGTDNCGAPHSAHASKYLSGCGGMAPRFTGSSRTCYQLSHRPSIHRHGPALGIAASHARVCAPYGPRPYKGVAAQPSVCAAMHPLPVLPALGDKSAVHFESS